MNRNRTILAILAGVERLVIGYALAAACFAKLDPMRYAIARFVVLGHGECITLLQAGTGESASKGLDGPSWRTNA
jgi:hypothetical protein